MDKKFYSPKEVANYMISILESNDGRYFENFVYNTLKSSDSISSVIRTQDRCPFDLIADYFHGESNEKLFIEIKFVKRFLRKDLLCSIIDRMSHYRDSELKFDSGKLVLILNINLKNEHIKLLADNGIEAWGIDEFFKKFPNAPSLEMPSSYGSGTFFSSKPSKTPFSASTESLEFLVALANMDCGKENWNRYENLVFDIFKYLFKDQFSEFHYQSRDEQGVNIRDLIIPNYSKRKYLKLLRKIYFADFILVDAKNYCGKIGKEEVLQVSNYLKIKGLGLFAIIVCRSGNENSSGFFTRIEHWKEQNKMIIILSDHDLEEMLNYKDKGKNPEEILIKKIELFRMSV